MRMNKESIKAKIADKKIEVVSFDYFDTLIIRPFFSPTDLFFFLDREASVLLRTNDLISFGELRREAEKTARTNAANSGKEEVSLGDIYNVIKDAGIFPDEVVNKLMEKEKELEERYCYARNSALDLMKYAASLGKRVVIISDMYMPATLLERILKKNGFPKPERIFVSCEIGCTKHTGSLYRYALQQLEITKDKIIHIGDNMHSDVRMARKEGICAIPFYRPVDLLTGKYPSICGGRAFRFAYKQIRSSFPNFHATLKFGTRCMLAVAANRAYDDPYRAFNKNGEYAGDELLFGNLALGMYCLAQAFWVYGLTGESFFDQVLFFSRDGYLPWLGYEMLRKKHSGGRVESKYVRTSRKIGLPLLLTNEKTVASASSYVNWKSHSPKTITKYMMAVLRDDTMSQLESVMQDKWTTGFSSQTEMMQYLMTLYTSYCDEDKKKRYIESYKKYFTPFMGGDVLTYDVGYHLRNEMLLNYFFPETNITAAYTHASEDQCLIRGNQSGISIREFYPSAPYVSWLVRELFLTENAPSCVGYTHDGKEIFGDYSDSNDLINHLQKQAIAYMEQFVEIFNEDISLLPINPTDAALPFEAFLHSPSGKEKKWIKNIDAENSIDAQLKDFNCYIYWRKIRLNYWLASHHIEGLSRHFFRFVMLLFTDRTELKELIEKRLPKSMMKHTH